MNAQSPIIKAYAYSRSTIPGIREEVVNDRDSVIHRADNPFPVTYYLYVAAKKDTRLSISGVWLEGKYYTATLQKVKTPVVVENNSVVKQKDTLVKKTGDDVYTIQLGNEKNPASLNEREKKLVQNNEVLFFLQSNKAACYSPVKTIKRLTPFSAM
jgi:hypothetical protein